MKTGNIELSFSGGMSCFISKPTKATLNMALIKAKKDKLGLAQVIIQKSWVSGDEKIQDDEGCLLEFMDWIDEVCEVKTCEAIREGESTKLVFEDGTELILKQPSRLILNEAMNKGARAPLAMAEHIILHCCTKGDKEKVFNDIGYLIPASGCMDDIMQKKTMTLKRS
jgi:hypothetical protein